MTPRERAELYARVARRIGACTASAIHEGRAAHWSACVTWSKDGGFHTFDPVANLADERRVLDWLDAQGIGATWYWHEGTCCMLLDGISRADEAESECRVTAFLLAIDALPEVDGD